MVRIEWRFFMNKVYQLFFVALLFYTSSAYAFEPMNTFENNLEKITQESTASSSALIGQGDHLFQVSSKAVFENTQFYIGSVTKHMTAYMLLMTLHEHYPKIPINELLTENVNALFPESRVLKIIHNDWTSQISLLDLLTHRSGLSDYIDNFLEGGTVSQMLNEPKSASELLQSITFNPQKEYQYANSNYYIIGKLIEEIRDETLTDSFDTLIVAPAGLEMSYCPVSQNYFSLKQAACCQDLAPNLNEKVFLDMANALGAGNVISTPGDLVKWGRYLFKSAPKVIVNAMLEDYGTDPDGDVLNLGLSTTETSGLGEIIGHQGSLDSFNCFFGYIPERDTLIIFLSNDNDDVNLFMGSLISWISEPEQEVIAYDMILELSDDLWGLTDATTDKQEIASTSKDEAQLALLVDESDECSDIPCSLPSDLTWESFHQTCIPPELYDIQF